MSCHQVKWIEPKHILLGGHTPSGHQDTTMFESLAVHWVDQDPQLPRIYFYHLLPQHTFTKSLKCDQGPNGKSKVQKGQKHGLCSLAYNCGENMAVLDTMISFKFQANVIEQFSSTQEISLKLRKEVSHVMIIFLLIHDWQLLCSSKNK